MKHQARCNHLQRAFVAFDRIKSLKAMDFQALFAIILSYLFGAIPFGVLVGRARGVDVRAVGSGNIGTTNVWRTLGPLAGSVVFLLDVAKGWAGPLFAHFLAGDNANIKAICAVVAVLGHTFSIFLRGGGGKGIATAFGALLGLSPVVGLTVGATWALVLAVSKYVSVASIVAAIVVLVLPLVLQLPFAYIAVMMIMGVLAIVKHQGNIERLRNGTEPRLGSKKTETPSSKANARW